VADLSNGDVTVYFYENAYYKYSSSNIVSSNTGSDDDGTEKVFDAYEVAPISSGDRMGYIRHAFKFTPKVVTGPNGFQESEYVITFTAVPQEYIVTTEIFIDGEKATEDQIEAYGLAGSVEKGAGKPGDTTNFAFTTGVDGKYCCSTNNCD